MLKYLVVLISLGGSLFAFDLSKSMFDVSLSTINGTSKEVVYSGDDKISELTWRLEDVSLLGLNVSNLIHDQIVFNAGIKINTGNPDSTMDDYDWLSDVHNDWTHWSNHPETSVEEVFKLDVNLQGLIFQSNKNTIYGIIGYKYDTFKWIASNTGTYTYTTADNTACHNDSSISCTYNNNYRDTTWSSTSDSPGITYNQYFYGMYVGLGVVGSFSDALVINGDIKYSPMISANDEDTHHNRDLYFEENFEDISLLELAVNLKYVLNKNFSFFLGYSYMEYELTKGDTYITDLSTNIVYYGGEDSSGISHDSYMYTYGIKLSF